MRPRMQTQLFCPEGGCSGTWRLMPLRGCPLQRRFSYALPVPGLLLLDLPQDGGGYAINLGGDSSSLRVEGEENITAFQARVRNPEDEEASTSPATRHFCSLCGSALWLYDPRWPELVHPFASAIDTPLPEPPEMVRIMLEFTAPWCEIPEQGKDERHFRRDPEESLEEWHRRHGLYEGA